MWGTSRCEPRTIQLNAQALSKIPQGRMWQRSSFWWDWWYGNITGNSWSVHAAPRSCTHPRLGPDLHWVKPCRWRTREARLGPSLLICFCLFPSLEVCQNRKELFLQYLFQLLVFLSASQDAESIYAVGGLTVLVNSAIEKMRGKWGQE